jgi:hypothetical protein
MVVTDRVIAGAEVVAVIRTVQQTTARAGLTTGGAIAFVTSRAALQGQRPPVTGGALLQAGQTVRLIVKGLIEAWSHLFTASGTRDEAAPTETLTAAFTTANLRAVLLATGATDRTVAADKCRLTLLGTHMIEA